MLTWNSPHAELHLAKRDLIRLSDAAHTVTCHAGSLWITQDGDSRDIVLEAGQCFTTEENTGTVVAALTPARLVIEHHRPHPADATCSSRERQRRWTPSLPQAAT